jgi:hypothetical protein
VVDLGSLLAGENAMAPTRLTRRMTIAKDSVDHLCVKTGRVFYTSA